MGECAVCYAEIPDNKCLCAGCENDIQEAKAQVDNGERLFKERQARAMAIE